MVSLSRCTSVCNDRRHRTHPSKSVAKYCFVVTLYSLLRRKKHRTHRSKSVTKYCSGVTLYSWLRQKKHWTHRSKGVAEMYGFVVTLYSRLRRKKHRKHRSKGVAKMYGFVVTLYSCRRRKKHRTHRSISSPPPPTHAPPPTPPPQKKKKKKKKGKIKKSRWMSLTYFSWSLRSDLCGVEWWSETPAWRLAIPWPLPKHAERKGQGERSPVTSAMDLRASWWYYQRLEWRTLLLKPPVDRSSLDAFSWSLGLGRT